MSSLLSIREKTKPFLVIVLSLMLFSTVVTMNTVYATPVFSGPQVLDGGGPFGGSRIAVSGSNVHSIWLDPNGDVAYLNSTDNGNTFDIGGPILFTASNSAFNGRVAATGNNVYVVYSDVGSGTSVQNSTDNGDNFSVYPVTADEPTYMEISATGDYLYVAWIDGSNNVQLAASLDNGVTFDTINLGAASGTSSPVITSSGDVAFVAWEDSSNDIVVEKITNDSVNFSASGSPQNLSGTGTATQPKIAATGTKVYVAWEDSEFGDSEIYFSKSTDSGVTFNGGIAGTPGLPVNLSGNTGESVQPDISAAGSNVFVVWRDNQFAGSLNYEILLQSSSNNGATFNGGTGTPVNLSGNSANSGSLTYSESPKISTSGSEAYVVWQDDPFDSGDILFRTIFNNGNTIGGIKNISQSPNTSEFPQVASSATNVSVIWDDTPLISVSFNNAIPNDIDVSLDKTEYFPDDTAAITVKDASCSGSITVDVYKNTAFEFSRTLTCSGGVYTGTILFSSTLATDGPSGRLAATTGDLIDITEPTSGQTTFASIISSSGTINFTPATTAYDRGAIAHVTVTDPAANLNPAVAESVTVGVNSTTQPTPTLLTLQETGPNTGVFGNTANNKLIFITSSDNLWTVNSQITITQQHTGADVTPGIDTISETVLSTSDPSGITLTLTETGGSTGIFTGTLQLSNLGSLPGSRIYAQPGDIVQVIRGTAISNALIISGPSNVAAVLVNADPLVDTVTVSYGFSSVDAAVEQQFASGGGGGGISKAGLVVQAIGSISLFTGGGVGTSGPPSFDSASFSLESDGVKVSPESISDATSLTVGKKSDISLGFLMPGGLNNLDHIGLYANIGLGQDKYDADTYIYFDKFKTPQITIHDPHGFFKSVNIDVTEPTKSNIDVNFAFDFAKSLDNSNVVFEAWNLQRDSALKEIPGLLKVDDPTKPEVAPETTETITPTTEERPPVPDWVKSNAAWWGKGAIDDTEFTNGIGYLIQNKIINVPGLLQKNTSPEKVINPDTGIVEPEEEFIPVVPDWVKNNAVWWSEGQLTDDDFLVGIQYLLEQGIIQVRV